MINRYNQQVLDATHNLIEAIKNDDLVSAREALENDADVNCRLIQQGKNYRLAHDEELTKTLYKRIKNTTCYGALTSKTDLDYVVPMSGTTTLLNIFALANNANNNKFANLLMDHGADLAAIDYASFWDSYSNSAENYFQNTPLLNAIAASNSEFAHIYLGYLNKLDTVKRKEILDYKDKFKEGFHTALEFAIRRGLSELATEIVLAGANPNPIPFIFSYAGKSPLHMACMALGQAYSPKIGWYPQLGSGLDLILALLDNGAEYKLTVMTDIYQKTNQYGRLEWQTIPLTAFDHLDLTLQPTQTRQLDIFNSCQAPAFQPKKAGQIKHPFYGEYCFSAPILERLYGLGFRAKYLSSEQFKQDKIILQQALLARIVKDFEKNFPRKKLSNIDLEEDTVEHIVKTLLDHDKNSWFKKQMAYAGLIYDTNRLFYCPDNLKLTPEILRTQIIGQNSLPLPMITGSINDDSSSSVVVQPKQTNAQSPLTVLDNSTATNDDIKVYRAGDSDGCNITENQNNQSQLTSTDKSISNEAENVPHLTNTLTLFAPPITAHCNTSKKSLSSIDDTHTTLRTQLIKATNDYLDWSNKYANGHRLTGRWCHWYHGTSGRQRAKALLAQLEQSCDLTAIMPVIIDTFNASGYRQHALSRYLWQAFNPDKPPVIDNKITDNDFALMKQTCPVRLIQNNIEIKNQRV